MPCLTTCCCGFSVKAGTRAIAILSVVYSVLGLLMVGTFNLEKDRLLERQLHGWPTNGNPSFHGVVDSNVNENILHHEPAWPEDDIHALSKEDLKEYEKKKRLELMMSVYAISVSVNFVVSLSLLAGVKLEKRWLLLPWVAWNSLSLIVSQMAVFYVPNKSVTTIPDIFSTGISIYCIMCVYSYFQILSETPRERSRDFRSAATCRQTTQATWTGGQVTGQVLTTYISPGPLSPRSDGLTVTLPPDSPPAYTSPDNPPNYDPPPPYPGSPKDKKETFESQVAQADDSTKEEEQQQSPAQQSAVDNEPTTTTTPNAGAETTTAQSDSQLLSDFTKNIP